MSSCFVAKTNFDYFNMIIYKVYTNFNYNRIILDQFNIE